MDSDSTNWGDSFPSATCAHWIHLKCRQSFQRRDSRSDLSFSDSSLKRLSFVHVSLEEKALLFSNAPKISRTKSIIVSLSSVHSFKPYLVIFPFIPSALTSETAIVVSILRGPIAYFHSQICRNTSIARSIHGTSCNSRNAPLIWSTVFAITSHRDRMTANSSKSIT
jgi:hypothetical protein